MSLQGSVTILSFLILWRITRRVSTFLSASPHRCWWQILVTDEVYWWQVWNVNDRLKMLVTDSLHCKSHRHKVTNITVAPTIRREILKPLIRTIVQTLTIIIADKYMQLSNKWLKMMQKIVIFNIWRLQGTLFMILRNWILKVAIRDNACQNILDVCL